MHAHDADTLSRIVETRGGFGHREHLELAWNHLDEYGIDDATRRINIAIRHLADLHGSPGKFHETITRAWVHLVAVHRSGSEARTFDEFIAQNPGLLDRGLLGRHYSRELMTGASARERWTEPDLRALPALS
jgi:hypothetical protein